MASNTPLSSRSRLLVYGGSRDDVHSSGCDLPARLHDQLPIPGNITTVIGSEGGLVCLSSSCVETTNALFIWNPTSNDVCKIPNPDGGDHGKKSISFMGFYFEVSLHDYVICRVVPRWGCMHMVECFSLRDGSWKEVGVYNLPFRLLGDGLLPPVTLNGCIHWIVVHYGRSEYSNYGIVAFDLEIKEFVEIPFPDDLSPKEKDIRVGIYNGCLCLISYDEDYSEDGEIWVMRRYGRAESWKKEVSVSICLGIVQPFTSTGCGWGEDRKLLLKNCCGDLVLYDPKKETAVEVFSADEFDDGDDNDEYSRWCYQVAGYVETEASIDALVNRGGKRKGAEDEN